ncbi:hypothetical protein DOTSEDRAFT_73464 [Dothistroma septosporum NZE10]|uniref:Uncharacterized protein n=1 Tax=Dothistroma septosporum (strain NZE10 / CBS 128990) TaxID=675120 RepID=N1PM69_DOTSN|nr:hypothetical protein DOTSEDRAFT_73464 [Dothistroma septosporum NZE10]
MPLFPTSTRPVVEIFVHHGERGRTSLVTLSDFQLLDEEGLAFALTKLEIATIKVYNIVSKERHVYEMKVLEETENFVMSELASWTTTGGWVGITESPGASE